MGCLYKFLQVGADVFCGDERSFALLADFILDVFALFASFAVYIFFSVQWAAAQVLEAVDHGAEKLGGAFGVVDG